MNTVNAKNNDLVKLGNQLFEMEFREQALLIHKYCIKNQTGKITCDHTLHACILSEDLKNKTPSLKCYTPKLNPFTFEQLFLSCHSHELNPVWQPFIQSYGKKDVSLLKEEVLLSLPSQSHFMQDVAQFFLNNILKNQETATIAPKRWLLGIQIHVNTIRNLIENLGSPVEAAFS